MTAQSGRRTISRGGRRRSSRRSQDTHVSVYVRLLLGDATSAQLREIGRLATAFVDGTVRLTIDQNLLLPWVHPKSLPALFARLRAADLAKLDLHTARDVTSCQGADTCNLAVTSSRSVAAAITEKLEAAGLGAEGDAAQAIIKVSGCPNSCGQHHIADLGFHGGAKTVGKDTVPVYQLHLGGGVDARGAPLRPPSRQARRAARAGRGRRSSSPLRGGAHTPGETPAAFFERVDGKRVVALLGELVTAAPREGETADVGETTGFLVAVGEGECAA